MYVFVTFLIYMLFNYTGEEDATWKEIVVLKDWNVLHVYNVLSHGRRVFRSQVYTSHSSLSLACLEPSLGDRGALPAIVAKQAGNFKDLRQPEGSLVITRFGGEETLVPGRLLSGVSFFLFKCCIFLLQFF